MCSILGAFDLRPDADLMPLRPLALSLSAWQRHRGPDWSGVHTEPAALLVHERLAIVDPAGGAQPIRSVDGGLVLAVNGEIYNHRDLERSLATAYAFATGSDCEVINALYLDRVALDGIARDGDAPGTWLGRLNGIFAFALWDRDARRFLIARDPMGVCLLYWGHDAEGRTWVASEMKALVRVCDDVSAFPPGHCYDSAIGVLTQWYRRAWRDYDAIQGVAADKVALRDSFKQALHRQLMSDVPYGVLLSGGLDSSLVAACAARFARRRVETDDSAEAW